MKIYNFRFPNYFRKLIFLGILLLSSFYLTAIIHEFGHLFFYLIYGCEKFDIVIFPSLSGYVSCLEDLKFTSQQNLILLLGGMLFTGISGAMSFILFKSKKISNYLVLSFLFFLFVSNLGSTFLNIGYRAIDLTRFSDIREIIKITAIDNIVFIVVGFILLILLGYLFYKEFPNLLKIINPKITKEGVKKSFMIFSVFVIFILLIFILFEPNWNL